MRTRVAIVLAFVLVLGGLGCKKGGGGGFASPEEVGKAFAAAVNAKDQAALEALLPTEEVLKAAMECSGENPALKQLARARAEIAEGMQGELKDMSVEFLGLDTSREAKKKTMTTGTEEDGCKATTDITMMKVRFKFKFKVGDKEDEESEGMRLVQFGADGPWYLLKF